MSLVRNLYADLVEKRLLPVAAVLLIALVAVPVLLAKPAGDGSSPGTPATGNALLGKESAALIGETKPIVSLGSDGGFRKHVARLSKKNPFVQQGKRSASLSGDGATLPGAGGTTGAGGSPVQTPGSTQPSGGTEPVQLYEYVAYVKFGRVDESKSRRVTQAEFLPSENNPVLLYLGGDETGKSAQFLVSAEATARGDGECVPSESNCQIVQMSKDDTEFFEVALSAETVVTYELVLTDLKLEKSKDESVSHRNSEFVQRLTKQKLQKIRQSMRSKRVFKALDELGF